MKLPSISPGVFSLIEPHGAVVFDLWRNRYVALSSTSACIWKYLNTSTDKSALTISVARDLRLTHFDAEAVVARQLHIWVESGLIGRSASDCVGPVPRVYSGIAMNGGADHDGATNSRLSMSAVARIWWSTRRAHSVLQKKGLPSVLLAMQGHVSSTPARVNEEARKLLQAYHFVRRGFRQGRADCLERSLGLAWAMRIRGVDAVLCIGVISVPFRAHAWVEFDNQVMNESPEVAAQYSVLVAF